MFIEIPEFVDKFDKIATHLEMIELQDELGLTQKLLAGVVSVKLRTLQDWEIGRSPMPKAVEILMNLIREMPNIKEKLLSASK